MVDITNHQYCTDNDWGARLYFRPFLIFSNVWPVTLILIWPNILPKVTSHGEQQDYYFTNQSSTPLDYFSNILHIQSTKFKKHMHAIREGYYKLTNMTDWKFVFNRIRNFSGGRREGRGFVIGWTTCIKTSSIWSNRCVKWIHLNPFATRDSPSGS